MGRWHVYETDSLSASYTCHFYYKHVFFLVVSLYLFLFKVTISIPIYTRLLTVEDYGLVSVFLSVIGISSVLLTSVLSLL